MGYLRSGQVRTVSILFFLVMLVAAFAVSELMGAALWLQFLIAAAALLVFFAARYVRPEH